jgi:hypothetical protein
MQYVIVTGSSGKVIRSQRAKWKGHHLFAPSGAAEVQLFDGTSDAGVHVLTIHVKNGEHDDHVHEGVAFNAGIYYKVVSGSVTGSIFVE